MTQEQIGYAMNEAETKKLGLIKKEQAKVYLGPTKTNATTGVGIKKPPFKFDVTMEK